MSIFSIPVEHDADGFFAWDKHIERMIMISASCHGTPAAELSAEQKFAVAYCAGVRIINSEPVAGSINRFKMTMEPFAIVDDGDGGYIVSVRK